MVARCRVDLAIGLALGLSLAGCVGGSEDNLPRQAVSGRITLDDKPLEWGSITFDPADPARPDATSAGAVITDGAYAIARAGGPTPGTYRVAILGAEGGTGPPPDALPGLPPRLSAATKPMVPEKYNARSTLTAEVKSGESNTFNFELKSQ